MWVGKETQLKNWKDDLIPLIETFTDRTPGTFIEGKKIVWFGTIVKPILNWRSNER